MWSCRWYFDCWEQRLSIPDVSMHVYMHSCRYRQHSFLWEGVSYLLGASPFTCLPTYILGIAVQKPRLCTLATAEKWAKLTLSWFSHPFSLIASSCFDWWKWPFLFLPLRISSVVWWQSRSSTHSPRRLVVKSRWTSPKVGAALSEVCSWFL